jgi:hypothetical protein
MPEFLAKLAFGPVTARMLRKAQLNAIDHWIGTTGIAYLPANEPGMEARQLLKAEQVTLQARANLSDG